MFQRLLPTFYHPERRKQDYEYNLYLSIIGEKDTQTDCSYLKDESLLRLPNEPKTEIEEPSEQIVQTDTVIPKACSLCQELAKECITLTSLLQKRTNAESNDTYIEELERTVLDMNARISNLHEKMTCIKI